MKNDIGALICRHSLAFSEFSTNTYDIANFYYLDFPAQLCLKQNFPKYTTMLFQVIGGVRTDLAHLEKIL